MTAPRVEMVDGSLYRIEGVTSHDLEEALDLRRRVREVQGELADADRAVRRRALLAHGVEPMPDATRRQVDRAVLRRQRLLTESHVYTHPDIQRLRGQATVDAARAWVSEMRRQQRLFTVTYQNRTYVPGFLIDPEGDVVAHADGAITELAGAGMGGWEMWTWFASPTPLLDGRVPAETLIEDPDALASAAARLAANVVA